MPDNVEGVAPRPHPGSPADLFVAFTRLALMGFGGVLPVAQRELVERLGWLTQAEFAERLSIGQVLPGPNVINLALIIGDRYFGLRGAMAAVGGLIAAPMVLVLILAAAYGGLADIPAVAGAVRGMGAVAAGLVMAMALKLLPTLARNPLGRALWAPIAIACAVAIAGLRWPLIAVLLGLGSLSCAAAWWKLAPTATESDTGP